MALSDLRRAHDLTQQDVAKRLNVNQAWVSKFERQTDMYLSTLRAFVQAMGGELDLIARFGDGSTVRINGLEELASFPAAPVLETPVAQGASNASAQDVKLDVWTGASSKTVRSNTTADEPTTSSTTARAA
jgi:transcriptional regulator with XRE-family HTH domain